jgi:sugar phosphate isomerase/epimerase
MIYFSTGLYPKMSGAQAAEMFARYGTKSIELSGGKFEKNSLKKLKSMKKTYELDFQIHNYFPVPEKPFVFNLASQDRGIQEQSFNHAKTAIEACNFLGLEYYSFHAGFLFDPYPRELGAAIRKKPLTNRMQGLGIFLENVQLLSELSRKHGVTLLIENNVISRKNYDSFEANPFLMTGSKECIEVMETTPSNVKLLVDVGHVKVSARTMDNDPVSFLRETSAWANAYHLSENNGLEDENQPPTEDSWFWPYIKKGLDYYSLEFSLTSFDEVHTALELAKNKLRVDL